MAWLEKISITCFAASYAVVLALELSRLFGKFALRPVLRIGLTVAGLFAHTAFLVYHTSLVFDETGIWLGNWFGWCLTAAWIVAAIYLALSIRRGESPMGLFLLPIVLVLIGVGKLPGGETPFTPDRANSIWGMAHGVSLLLGTVVVAVGFGFGVMYLFQARRLKNRTLGGNRLFRLPSLEWLQRLGEWSLIVSTIFLGVGLLSGMALNIDLESGGIIPWSDPVIWTSSILFGWLLAATLFSAFYRPARQGKKVAYLVSTSFLFLLLELGVVWWAGHATDRQRAMIDNHSPCNIAVHGKSLPKGWTQISQIRNSKFEIWDSGTASRRRLPIC